MQTFSNSIGASATWRIHQAGKFCRLLSTTGPVDVRLYRLGNQIGEAVDVEAGFWTDLEGEEYDAIEIVNKTGASNTVKVGLAMSKMGYDRSIGAVEVTKETNNGAVTHTTNLIQNYSYTALAANAARRFLMIQNRDPAVTMYLRFDNQNATTAAGFKLGPGETMTFDQFCPTGDVRMIGSATGTVPSVWIEG